MSQVHANSLSIIEGYSSQLADMFRSEHDNGTTAHVDVFMPLTDWAAARKIAPVLAQRANCAGRLLLIEDDAGKGFLQTCNEAFALSDAPFVVYLAQDAFPGRQWLALALHVLQTQNKGLLAFNDGKWFGQLAGFGLVRRTWVESVYGGDTLFHAAYHSHYADTELTLIAQQQSQLAYNPNAVLVEVDVDKDRKPTNPQDKALFAQRKESGFNGRVSDKALIAKFR